MFKLSIISAERILFEGEIEFLSVPTVTGEVGILSHHHPLVAELGVGGLRLVKPDKSESTLFVAGGFLEVSNNQATVLADTAEHLEEIEESKARDARISAEQAMKNSKNILEKENLLKEINLQLMREKLVGVAKYKKK